MKTLFTILLTGVLSITMAFAQKEYQSFDIKGATNTYITDINNKNEIVGYFDDANGTHSFYCNLAKADTVVFDMPGAAWTKASDINDSSVMAGTFTNLGVPETQGFFYNVKTKTISVPTDGDMVVVGGDYITLESVRNDSCIVGNFRNSINRYFFTACPGGGVNNGFCSQGTTKYPTYAYGFAKTGEVCGFYLDGANYIGFLWKANKNFTSYKNPTSGISKLRFYDMNDNLIAVGDIQKYKGFIHDLSGGGKYNYKEIDLSHLNATVVTPQGINNNDDVVGFYTDGNGKVHGFTQKPIDIFFRPDKNGWKFSNSEVNMWPKIWWQQFKYTQYDPYRGPGTTFPKTALYKSWVFPDWPLFVEVFGKNYCYSNSPVPQIKQEAVEEWKSILKALKYSWGGSCYGFSTTAILAYDSLKGYNQKFSFKTESDNELYNEDLTDSRRRIVNNLMIYQFAQQVVDFERGHRGDVATKTLGILKDRMRANKGDNYNIVILNSSVQDPGGGHSLLPYKITKDENDPKIEWIWIYDSNYPGDNNRAIKVNTVSQKWFYKATLNTSGNPVEWGDYSYNMYVSNPSSDYINDAMPPAKKKLVPHIVYPSGSDDVLVISGKGDTAGFYKGKVYQNLGDSTYPLWVYDGKISPPYGYRLNEDAHEIKMENLSDTVRLYAVRDGARYEYLRTGANSSESENFNIDEAFEVKNIDAAKKTFSLNSIIPGSSEITFSISNISLQQSENLDFEAGSDDLQLTNPGSAKTYDLEVTRLDNSGKAVFRAQDIPLDPNTKHIIIPNKTDWREGKIWIKVDKGIDGSIDDTLFYENTAKPEISVSRYLLMFDKTSGTDTVYLANTGGGKLNWSISSQPSWVTISPSTSGVDDGMLIIDHETNTSTIRDEKIVIEAADATNSPFEIELIQDGKAVGIAEAKETDHWKLFPVPATETVYLWHEKTMNRYSRIEIQDLSGKVVYKFLLTPSFPSKMIKLEVSNWAPGMYIIKIADEEGTVTKKLMVR